VENCSNTTAALEEADDSLDDPKHRDDSEDKGRDMNEAVRTLMVPDTPQAPSDGEASSEVTFRAGERVRSACPGKEKEGEEDEELGPKPSRVCSSVDTESLKGGQPDKDNGPPVVKGERKVDKKLACQADAITLLVDDVIYVAHGGTHKEDKNVGNNIVAVRPDADVDGIERCKKREAPADAIDDEVLAGVGKLEENEAKKEEVNKRPDEEGPKGWSEISLLSRPVDIARANDGVDIAPKEREIHHDVHNLEDDAILPRVG